MAEATTTGNEFLQNYGGQILFRFSLRTRPSQLLLSQDQSQPSPLKKAVYYYNKHSRP